MPQSEELEFINKYGLGDADALRKSAEGSYPFMKNNNYTLIRREPKGGRRNLEYYSSTETGDPGVPAENIPAFLRDPRMPLGKPGVEIYDRRVNEMDLAGDVLSHMDPVGTAARDELLSSMTDEQIGQLSQQYLDFNYTLTEDSLKGRDMDKSFERAKQNGVDGLVRTAALGQGGPRAVNGLGYFNFTPDQEGVLANVKHYANTGVNFSKPTIAQILKGSK